MLAAFTSHTISTASAAEIHGRPVQGRILETYKRLGGYNFFGNATINESNAGRGGKFQVFEKNSSIYWHPNISNGVARQVGGSIRDKWRDWGWENGSLRYPTTDETSTPDRSGRFNHFENGSIYWSPATNAQVVQGSIKDRWSRQGWEAGPLGYPTTDEVSIADGRGRFNHFQNGSIYWTGNTGAQIVKGRIRDYWASRGWENGPHGFPTGEEVNIDGGIQQDFEKLNIQWVAPNSQVLPTEENLGLDDYQMQFPVIAQDARWTPQSVAREVTEHFDSYFTYQGCGQKIHVGDKCNLKIVRENGLGSAPIEITSITPDGFSIKSLPGHPEGADRTITFRFVSKPGTSDPSKSNVYMVTTAWGPAGNASWSGPFNSQTVARYSWGRFSRNLNAQLNNASTDYLTADKNVDSARLLRRSIAQSEDIGLDSPIVNLTDAEVAWVPSEVPLIPLDGSPAPEIIPADVVDSALREKLS